MHAMSQTVAIPRRYADGHKVKAPRPREGANTIWRRISDNVDEMIRLGCNPRLASVVGRLLLFKILTGTEGAAAFRYAEVVGRYDRYYSQQRRQMASPAYDAGYGRDDEVTRRERDGSIRWYERQANRARKEWLRLQRLIPNAHARAVIDDVCVNNLEISSALYPDLKVLLRAIGNEYGAEAEAVRNVRKPRVISEAMRIAMAVLDQQVQRAGDRGARIVAFVVRPGQPSGELGVDVFCTVDGESETRLGFTLKHGQILPEALTAAVLSDAARRGWKERDGRTVAADGAPSVGI